jgi:deazaflavin-dependent oxidoreductase (nitroreductase family)
VEYKSINKLFKFFLRSPYHFFNNKTAKLFGKRFIEVTSIGRASGKERKTLLEVIFILDTSPVVIAAFGPKSDWVLNLRKNPICKVQWANKSYKSKAIWVDDLNSSNILDSYKKKHPLLVKVYEKILGMDWESFKGLPVCCLPKHI